ncbi:MAG: hypothetical protein CEO19_279 [Parcubacteria group bacterium Gr01-1014_73]|nr:MAG: hypothetical protein CEO19_279 [Parcubacteria group bacterium Gr01-1014_73]
MTKLELLKRKEQELTNKLTKWMRKNKAFGPGDFVEVNIVLKSQPLVAVKIHPSGTGGRRYKNISTVLSPEDWVKIFDSRIPEHYKDILRFIQDSKNVPVDRKELESHSRRGVFSCIQVNLYLRKAGLNFRVREVARNQDDTDWLCQMFIVEVITIEG